MPEAVDGVVMVAVVVGGEGGQRRVGLFQRGASWYSVICVCGLWIFTGGVPVAAFVWFVSRRYLGRWWWVSYCSDKLFLLLGEPINIQPPC